MLNSIPEKMDTAALLELPDALAEEGYSKVATGLPMKIAPSFNFGADPAAGARLAVPAVVQ